VDKDVRNRIQKATQSARALLEREYAEQLGGVFDIRVDGTIATAIGIALAERGPVVVLLGDVAFLHDASSLTALCLRGADVRIVVVVNDGGGIFSFLPQADVLSSDRFELLFGTPHGTDLVALAAATVVCVVATVSMPLAGPGDVLPAAVPSVTNTVAVATPGDTASGGNNASSIATVVLAQSPLVAEKAAGSTTAEIGDVVNYTLTVQNQSAQPVPAVVFNDQLPLGFAYQQGTARVNGAAVPDPAGAPE
jgi:uncharacterized repeat protein (TIGR01451 family)